MMGQGTPRRASKLRDHDPEADDKSRKPPDLAIQ
jgi:hypothetical protein